MLIDGSGESHDQWWLNPWLMMVKSMGDDAANPCSEPLPVILLLSSEFHMLFDILQDRAIMLRGRRPNMSEMLPPAFPHV